MPEKTLEELKELSKPALRHAELVDLARTETPNKADELASIRWPRRQAKATRFLAMVRRDYGQRAFEALIKTEHVQPTGLEHARGEEPMFESLYPEGVRDVVFMPDVRSAEDLVIGLIGKGENQYLKLKEEVVRLGLDSDQEKTLVRRVLEAMLVQWASPKVQQFAGGRMWPSAVLAVRTYFPDDKELYKRVITAAMIYNGGLDKSPAGLAWAIVPEKWMTIRDPNYLAGCASDKALQVVLDHMLEVGFTEDEIHEIWQIMLMSRFKQNFLTSCIYEWWHGLKMGERYLGSKVAKETSKLCLLRDLRNLMDDVSSDTLSPHSTYLSIKGEGWLEMLESVASSCWDWCGSSEGREVFEDLLIGGLARGQAAKVSIILARFGRYFRFCSFEVTLCEQKQYKDSLDLLIRGAIVQASERRNFGVACALAEYLGETVQADELREKARHLGQRIALDFVFYTRET